jgi:hypothetical protein
MHQRCHQKCFFVVCDPRYLNIAACRESTAGDIAIIHNSASVSNQVQVHYKRDSTIIGVQILCAGWICNKIPALRIGMTRCEFLSYRQYVDRFDLRTLHSLGSAENCCYQQHFTTAHSNSNAPRKNPFDEQLFVVHDIRLAVRRQ